VAARTQVNAAVNLPVDAAVHWLGTSRRGAVDQGWTSLGTAPWMITTRRG